MMLYVVKNREPRQTLSDAKIQTIHKLIHFVAEWKWKCIWMKETPTHKKQYINVFSQLHYIYESSNCITSAMLLIFISFFLSFFLHFHINLPQHNIHAFICALIFIHIVIIILKSFEAWMDFIKSWDLWK